MSVAKSCRRREKCRFDGILTKPGFGPRRIEIIVFFNFFQFGKNLLNARAAFGVFVAGASAQFRVDALPHVRKRPLRGVVLGGAVRPQLLNQPADLPAFFGMTVEPRRKADDVRHWELPACRIPFRPSRCRSRAAPCRRRPNLPSDAVAWQPRDDRVCGLRLRARRRRGGACRLIGQKRCGEQQTG